MLNNPKVSIIIPVYNGSNFLKESIESAINQTYENIEIIVINDGSNDNGLTENIAISFGNKIRYFYKENGGVASALNFGINVMNGDYFSWLSHDDVYKSFKVEEQINVLNNLLSEDTIIYSNYELIDENSRIIKKNFIKSSFPERIKLDLILDYPINGCTLLIPKKCFTKIGFFNENLTTTQDYDMWFRLSEIYRFFYISKVLISSRIHKSQTTNLINVQHKKEVNDFLIKSLNKITEKELLKFGIKSLDLFYLNSAINFKKRCLKKSSIHAYKLVKKNNNIYIIIKKIIYHLSLCYINKILNSIKRIFLIIIS